MQPEVRGLVGNYRDKFQQNGGADQYNHMHQDRQGQLLLRPWLERLPNIAGTRADRLIQALDATYKPVLSDVSRSDRSHAVD